MVKIALFKNVHRKHTFVDLISPVMSHGPEVFPNLLVGGSKNADKSSIKKKYW